MPLEAVLCTEELDRRPSRPPDHERENRALVALARALTEAPRNIQQTLTDTLLEVFQAGSAGISVLDETELRFYWVSVSGSWKSYVGGGTPRDHGPCGDVLDRGTPLLFRRFERRYAYFLPIQPPAEECLLVPFHLGGRAVGTVWLVSHDQSRRFDAEDLRQLVSVSKFASVACEVMAANDRTLAMNEALVLGSVRQHEIAAAAHTSNVALTAMDIAKNQFIEMLSHELRSPLNTILLWTRILQNRESHDSDSHEGLEIIYRSIKGLARLIEDLLDVHRISAGKFRLELGEVDLALITRSVVDAMAPAATERKVRLIQDVPAVPILMSGDPARLQQLLSNLIGNAVKFTPEGGEIRVSLESAGDRTEIRVRDTGHGISAAGLPRVFDRFRQDDGPTSRQGGGLGLGLTIAKQIVELHGGTITAESPGKDQGSTFTVSLPLLKRITSRPMVTGEEGAGEQQASLAGVCVLVVDDDADTRAAVSMVLEDAGAETIVAGSTDEALQAFGRRQPDVILSDLSMSGKDGYDLVRSIRALPPASGGRVPAIALTARALPEDRERVLSAGYQRHLAKPIEPATLLAAIAALV